MNSANWLISLAGERVDCHRLTPRTVTVAALEPRILMDAEVPIASGTVAGLEFESLNAQDLFAATTWLEPIADMELGNLGIDAEQVQLPEESSPSVSAEVGELKRVLIAVDESVADYQQFVDDLLGRLGSDIDASVVIIRSGEDGIDAVTARLAELHDVSAVHVVSHGQEGRVQLGRVTLDSVELEQRAASLHLWSEHLAADADVLFYGCSIAATSEGQALIDRLSALIEADVAASDDPTGHELLGGDWTLEYQVGSVDEYHSISAAMGEDWLGLLPAAAVSENSSGTQITADADGGSQHAIAMSASGDYVIVWSSDDNGAGRDTSGFGVYAQRFDRYGNKVGGEIVVNAARSGDQNEASVAMDDAGNFVVVWTNHNSAGPGNATSVWVKRYDSNGNVIMADTRITTGPEAASNPTIAMNSSGQYAIAWQQVSSSRDIFAAVYAAGGTSIVAPFLAHTASADDEVSPSVAIAVDGSFAVFWENSSQAWGQRFGPTGAAVFGSPIVVAGNDPAVAIANDASMMVVYASAAQVWLDHYDGSGALLSTQSLSGPQYWVASPTITQAHDGSYFATWNEPSPDGSNFSFARIDASGNLIDVTEVSDSGWQSYGSIAAYDLSHYAFVYTTVTFDDYGDVESEQVGDWNQAPTSSDAAVTSVEDVDYVFQVGDFPYSDGDGDALGGIEISSLPDLGSLTLNGTAISAGQFVSAADLTAGKLVYVPVPEASGTSYTAFGFRVRDALAFSPTQTMSIDISAVDDPPVLQSPLLFYVAENNTAVGFVNTLDPDSSSLTYSIIGGPDQSLFAIDESAGAIAFISSPDFESPLDSNADNEYRIRVRVSDGSNSDARDITIRVTNVNEAPVGLSVGTTSLAENTDTSSGLSLGAFAVSDQDVGDTHSFLIVGGADSGRFSIGGAANNELIMTAGILDFESQAAYEVVVRVIDSAGNTYDQAISILVMDINEPVTDLALSNDSVPDNSDTSSGWVIGSLTATDSETWDVHSFSVAGGPDAAKFSVVGNQLVLTDGVLDRATQASYEVQVQAVDLAGNTFVKSFTISVTSINLPPSDINPNSFVVQEGDDSTGGVVLGALTASDGDVGETFSFAIVGGADAGKFTLGGPNGDVLLLADGILDPVRQSGYNVTIEVTDSVGNTYAETLHVHVNAAPRITSNGGSNLAFASVNENGVYVTTVTAVDADMPVQALTYSIVGGADAALFTIDSATGALTFVAAPNYESPTDDGLNNVYDVTVRVSDGVLIDEQSISVTVTAQNDNAPQITSNGGGSTATVSVAENTIAVTTVTATDADLPAQSLTYRIVGGADQTRFTINATTGVLQFLSGPNFESPNDANGDGKYQVDVSADDGAGLSMIQSLTVVVLDVNEPVADLTPLLFATTENVNTSGGLTLGGLEAIDPDLIDAHSFAIIGGPDRTRFALTGPQGNQLVLADGVLDFERQAAYAVDIRVTDAAGHFVDRRVVVRVEDVNEAPVAAGESINVSEGATYVGAAGCLLLNDFDPEGGLLTTSLATGPQHGVVTVLVDGSFTYAHDGSETTFDQFAYIVLDDVGHQRTAWVAIAIDPVNDAPIAGDDSLVTVDLSPVVIGSGVLLANDFDAEGSLQIVSVQPAQFGAVALNPDGTILYTPSGNVLGLDQFVYQVADAGGAMSQATVTVITPGVGQTPPPSSGDATPTPSDGSTSPPPGTSDTLAPPETPPAPGANPPSTNRDDDDDLLGPPIAPRVDSSDDVGDPVGSGSAASDGGLRSNSDGLRGKALVTTVAFGAGQADDRTVVVGNFQLSAIQMLDNAFYSSLVWRELQGMAHDIVSESRFRIDSLASVTGLSSVLTVGYAVWLIRGGMLLAGLASSMQAWHFFDPLSVVQFGATGSDDEDDDSLETLVAENQGGQDLPAQAAPVA